MPVNGRVWYPHGGGPYPLVLIVHGNHNMKDYSDPGYAYLGTLLASRGHHTYRNRLLVGVPGFEPGTSPTRTARATRLRHTPKLEYLTSS